MENSTTSKFSRYLERKAILTSINPRLVKNSLLIILILSMVTGYEYRKKALTGTLRLPDRSPRLFMVVQDDKRENMIPELEKAYRSAEQALNTGYAVCWTKQTAEF